MSPPLELLRHAAHPIRVGQLRLKFFWVFCETVFLNIFPKRKWKWAAHPTSNPSLARLARDSFLLHIVPLLFSSSPLWYKLWAGNMRQNSSSGMHEKGGFCGGRREVPRLPLYMYYFSMITDLLHISWLIHKYTIVQCSWNNQCWLSAAHFISFQLHFVISVERYISSLKNNSLIYF